MGGFTLAKNYDFSNDDIGKIELQCHSDGTTLARIQFFDRDDKSLVEITTNYGYAKDIQTFLLEEDEKLVGFETHSNENVVYGLSLKIAKGSKE